MIVHKAYIKFNIKYKKTITGKILYVIFNRVEGLI